MIRTYVHKHKINNEKQNIVRSVVVAYRATCAAIAHAQWRTFFEGDFFNKMADVKNISSKLSERYKRNCCYQVVGALKSFISNRQNDFSKIVYASSLNAETKKHLFQINRRKLWFAKTDDNFTVEELFLARKIFKKILSRHRKPSFRYVNMQLNSNVAQITLSDKKESPEFHYWIKLSTLESGKPIMLPILENAYFEKLGGDLCESVQVNFKDDEIVVALVKDVPEKKLSFQMESLAIDIGLRNLFALNTGDIMGRNFIDTLKYYNKIISKLSANRQRQGLDVKSKKYNSLVRKLRAWIRNEVGRLLNRIVKRYAPKKIVIERLDFRNQGLSRWMNRLLGNFGKGEIIRKLKTLKEEFGIDYQEINPAYTSQQCPNEECGYVDKSNRLTQDKFVCKCCGLKGNADVVGAKNHLARSSDKYLSNIFLPRKKVLEKLVMRFLERQSCHRSLANGLLAGNIYFREARVQPKLVA